MIKTKTQVDYVLYSTMDIISELFNIYIHSVNTMKIIKITEEQFKEVLRDTLNEQGLYENNSDVTKDQYIIKLNKFLKIVPLKLPFKGLTYEGVCEIHSNKKDPILCFNYTYQGDLLLSPQSLGLNLIGAIKRATKKYKILDSIGEEIFFKVSADVNGEEYTFTNKHLDVSQWWRTKSIPELKKMVVPEKYSFKELSKRFIGKRGYIGVDSSLIIDYTISNVIENGSNFYLDSDIRDRYNNRRSEYVISLDFEIVIDNIRLNDNRKNSFNIDELSQDKIDAAINYLKNTDIKNIIIERPTDMIEVGSGDSKFSIRGWDLVNIGLHHIDEDKLNNITITTDISSNISGHFYKGAEDDMSNYLLNLIELQRLSDEIIQMNDKITETNVYHKEKITVSSVNGIKPTIDGDSFNPWSRHFDIYESRLVGVIINQYYKENKN